MDSTLHSLLIANDVEGSWEFPPGSDWKALIAEVESLQPNIEKLLGAGLFLDKNVQDASFFADLGLLKEQRADTGVLDLSYQVCLRFSWFSKMFTVYGHSPEAFDISSVVNLLRENGFVYIPSKVLEEPYDGINKPYEAGLTWWVRYFDYL